MSNTHPIKIPKGKHFLFQTPTILLIYPDKSGEIHGSERGKKTNLHKK